MSRKNTIVVIGALLLMGAYIVIMSQDKNPISAPPNTIDPSAQTSPEGSTREYYEANKEKLVSGSPRPIQTDAASATNEANAETKSLSQKPVMELIPNLDDYKKEIAKSPQGAPPSLQKFSQAMNEKVEAAMKDQGTARELMPELGECVKRANVTSAQQICLVSAQRHQKKFPDLAPEAQAIEKSAPKDVVKRAKIMNPNN